MTVMHRLALALLLLSLSITTSASDHDKHARRSADIERIETSVEALMEALDRIGDELGQSRAAQSAAQSANTLRRDAHTQLKQGNADKAMELMQEALVTIKIEIAELKKGAQSDSSEGQASTYRTEKRQGELDHLNGTLDALTGALTQIGDEKARSEFAEEIVAQVRQQQLASQALAKKGALVDARNELDQALVTVKTAIATLRNRDTLVRSLNFASKEEEFRYEQDRYETYAMLINLLTEKLNPDGSTVKQMETFKQEAKQQQTKAQAMAEKGDFTKAVELQEHSNRSLLKAIRRGGIYVPG